MSVDYYEGDYDCGAPVFFARSRRVASTRKEHTCNMCHHAIPAGSPAHYFAEQTADTPTGRIDYGYTCTYNGPCFDPQHPRPMYRPSPVEDTNDPPF